MRIYKFSINLIFITLLALLYVHQQVQLVKISYTIEANEKDVATLLDQNKALMYNINKLKSPVSLEKNFLATKKEFGIPQQWQIVEVEVPKVRRLRGETAGKAPMRIAKEKTGASSLFSRIFGRPREVLANPVK